MNLFRILFNRRFLQGCLILILVLLATIPLYVGPYLIILLTTIIMYAVIQEIM